MRLTGNALNSGCPLPKGVGRGAALATAVWGPPTAMGLVHPQVTYPYMYRRTPAPPIAGTADLAVQELLRQAASRGRAWAATGDPRQPCTYYSSAFKYVSIKRSQTLNGRPGGDSRTDGVIPTVSGGAEYVCGRQLDSCRLDGVPRAERAACQPRTGRARRTDERRHPALGCAVALPNDGGPCRLHGAVGAPSLRTHASLVHPTVTTGPLLPSSTYGCAPSFVGMYSTYCAYHADQHCGHALLHRIRHD